MGMKFVFCQKYGKKNIGKKISKNLNDKYSEKRLDHAADAVKTASKRAIQKTAEVTGNLIGNKIADKITTVSKTSPQNNLVINEEEILRERYTSPKEKQKNIDYVRLMQQFNIT